MIFALSLLLSLVAATPFENQPRQGNETCPFATEPKHMNTEYDKDCGGLVTSLSTFNESINDEIFLVRRIVHIGRRGEAICFDTEFVDGDQVTSVDKLKIVPVRSNHSIDVIAESWRSSNLVQDIAENEMYWRWNDQEVFDMKKELRQLSRDRGGDSVVYGRYWRWQESTSALVDWVGRLSYKREGYCVRVFQTGFNMHTTVTYDHYINGSFIGDQQVDTVAVLPSRDILKSASVTFATMTEYQGELNNQKLFIDDWNKQMYQISGTANGPRDHDRTGAFWAPCHLTPDQLADSAEDYRWRDESGCDLSKRTVNKANYHTSQIEEQRKEIRWKNSFEGDLVFEGSRLRSNNYKPGVFTTVITAKAKVLSVRRIMGVITDFSCVNDGTKLNVKIVCTVHDTSVDGQATLLIYEKDSCASISKATFLAVKNAQVSIVVPQSTGDYNLSICTQYGRCIEHHIKVDKTVPPPPPRVPHKIENESPQKGFWASIGDFFAGIGPFFVGIFQSVWQTLVFVAIVIGIIVLIILVVRLGLCCCPTRRRRRKQEDIELQTK